jgi:hypothetical protein
MTNDKHVSADIMAAALKQADKMTDKINYRIDPKTGRPLHLFGDRAVVLNDDGSTVTEHYDENGRLYRTSYKSVPYPKDWKPE